MPKGKGPKPPAAGEITAFGVDIIKQYPGQEQVDLSVLVEIPGSWFGGALTTNERRDKYEAQAVEFTEVYEFFRVRLGEEGDEGAGDPLHLHQRRRRRRRAPGLLDEARRVEPLRKQSLWCLVSI